MKTVDISRRAARGLRNAKARTVLTSLAIAVGAFTITVSLAAGEGARQYADKLISSNVNPQALFIVKDKMLIEGGATQPPIREYNENVSSADGIVIEQVSQADVDKLLKRTDVSNVVPTYTPQVQYLEFGGSNKKFTASILTFDPTILSEVSSGKLPPKGKQLANDEAVIPESFVSQLIESGVIKKEGDLLGKKLVLSAVKSTVTPSSEEVSAAFASGGQEAVEALIKPQLKQFTFKIVGVIKRSPTALSGSTAVQISADSAREISEYTTLGTPRYQKYYGITAIVKDGHDPEKVKESITKDGLYAQTAEDLQGVVFGVVNTLQGIVFGFGIVALIASVFGIINTQYISVLERTREIGLMKALGMRGRSVSRLFQFEAAWIGFLGGIIGAAIAVVAGTALNPWITEQLKIGEGNYILIFELVPIIIMIISLVAIAMLAGWFPARKAAKLDPIEALRVE